MQLSYFEYISILLTILYYIKMDFLSISETGGVSVDIYEKSQAALVCSNL